MTRTQAALRSAAPMINDIALFVSADLLLSYAAIQNPWTQTFIFFGGMACPLIDFAMNLYSQNSESDYNRLRRALNLPRNALPIVGNILIFLAGWRMIYHGQIIFFGHTAKNGSRHHFILVPTSDSAPLGFTLTGTF
ncbi:MAG: hypothetical protein COU29_00150 [Candidatus Magasanikbacteria bacterium CG10_big_fil_rev_8_21_14_0_10_36_32]|uniref:Uncharacterized protein n=1 Tax=Candidatus Magasanikbacteria bacterium CG10_big_fil_rev_8_21_14_0_10_36_32 TaxID=1974646 RepID=A0A2M6W7N1_9BACT|nr:MAG: hypothetical protein COU29_00150 [Candidatus Magasanikbacteria bacterium CG10_big_fil_rev_8_21_14_0_10_36_32]